MGLLTVFRDGCISGKRSRIKDFMCLDRSLFIGRKHGQTPQNRCAGGVLPGFVA
jgi:hypothetical protein